MKTIAIVLNVSFLLFFCYIFITKGIPKDSENFFIIIVLIGFFIINLIALCRNNSEGWLGLFLKRKALEEKKKIEEINKKD